MESQISVDCVIGPLFRTLLIINFYCMKRKLSFIVSWIIDLLK